ncbi:hypothetical protein [Chitinimonas sp.]|uniref:hypothetical protein n=1 Tax=Chitinimonas sp. TaxID=1934313 RepID=UPI0035B2363B
MSTCRIHVSVFPLGSSEPRRVLAAVRDVWHSPSWISQRQFKGGWLVETLSEGVLPDQDNQAEFSQKLSIAIWQRLGRYVKVVIDVSIDESDACHRQELNRSDYLKLMRII